MHLRTTTAALLLALLVPVSGAPLAQSAGTPVTTAVPSRLPLAGHPTVPWVDATDQVIHDGDRTIAITPRVDKRVGEVWQTAGGYLVQGDVDGTLYRVGADGVRSPLLTSPIVGVVVEEGGQRVLVSTRIADVRVLAVLRVADGAVLASRPAKGYTLPVDFRAGVATFVAAGRPTTWDVDRDPTGAAVKRGGKRLQNPQFVDVGAGLMSRVGPGVRRLTVLPLAPKSTWKPWTVAADDLVSASPNGRWVITNGPAPRVDADGTIPTHIVVRDARTGAAKRAFALGSGGNVAWESNRRFVIRVYDDAKQRFVLVRLDLAGHVERVSDFSPWTDQAVIG